MRIVVTQPVQARERYRFDQGLCVLDGQADLWLNPSADQPPDEETLRAQIADTEGLVVGWAGSRLEPWVYENAPNLKMVALLGSSIKNISPETAWDRGVMITNTARAIGVGVAEYTVGWVLLWLHMYDRYDREMRAGGDWQTLKLKYLQRNIDDVRIGLVGFGAVGVETAQRMTALGASVSAFDPFVPDDVFERAGVTRVAELHDLIRGAEVLSIHTGLTEATRGMIGRAELALIPDGALLVNTSRGPVIDEAALIEELRSGRFDAALDVFEEEPLVDPHPLREMDNVRISPHAASSSNASVYHRCVSAIAEDFLRVARGESPANLVTPEMYARMT